MRKKIVNCEPKLPILSTHNFHCQDRLGKGGGDGNKRPPNDRKQTQGKKASHQPQHYKRLFTSVSLFVCIVSIKNSNWSMNYAFTLMDTCRRVIFPTCETFNWRLIDFQFTPWRMSSECHMTCQSAFA